MSTDHPTSNRRLWIAVLVLALVAIGTGTYALHLRTAERDAAVKVATNAADEGQSLADEVLSACRTGGKDASALSQAGLCGKAADTKDNIDQTVKDAPSTTTTTTIVRRETLPTGTLLAAIQSALDSRLRATCGADGCRDGKDSTVPGPVGPSSTVAGPEGQPGAQGPKGDTGTAGKDGTDGTNGTDGRGITSLVCSGGLSPITFTLTFTDGTTQEFSCGSVPADPDPQPAE